MGKGLIISGGTAGQYSVASVLNRDAATSEIARLTDAISSLTAQIAASEPGTDQDFLKSRKLGCGKRKKYLEDKISADETIIAWCADLTENLTGDVGLIEVPGESVSFNIQPGYNGNATYNQARDGQLVPTVIQTPAQAFYNLAILPGWQKWKPTFRYATITSIDGDTADVDLDPTTSSQQSLNVNQAETLESVTIEYMDCNGVAFNVGDAVIIKFENQSWSTPKIIGFKDNPQPCGELLRIDVGAVYETQQTVVWDIGAGTTFSGVTKNDGSPATFPVLTSEISDWLSSKSAKTSSPAVYMGGYNAVYNLPQLMQSCGNCGWIGATPSGCEYILEDVNINCLEYHIGSPVTAHCFHCSCDDTDNPSVTATFIDAEGNTNPQPMLRHTEYECWRADYDPTESWKTEVYYAGASPAVSYFRCESLTNHGGVRGLCAGCEYTDTTIDLHITTDVWFGLAAPLSNTNSYEREVTYNSPFVNEPAYSFTESIERDYIADTGSASLMVGDYAAVTSAMSDKNMAIVKIHQIRGETKSGPSGAITTHESYIDLIPIRVAVFFSPSEEDTTPAESLNPFTIPKNTTLTELVSIMANETRVVSDSKWPDLMGVSVKFL